MKKKYQVFVSSTYTDLRDDRQVAVETILKAGDIPAGMELFAASDESQMDVIKRWIDESDIYMLILGGRYGSIEPKSGKSYIQLEYEYAIERSIPFFAIVMSESLLEKRVKEYGTSYIETNHSELYKNFKDKVLKKMCKFYDDPKDIKLAIFETLTDYHNRYQLTGWISGKEFNLDTYISETQRLREENKVLKSEISLFEKKEKEDKNKNLTFSPDFIEERIGRLLNLLNYESIDSPVGWEEGEEPNCANYEVINNSEHFQAYFVYNSKEREEFNILEFIFIDDNSQEINLTSLLSQIRLLIEEIPQESCMTFIFKIISERISNDLMEECYSKFDYILDKSSRNGEAIKLQIWDNKIINQKEQENGLCFI